MPYHHVSAPTDPSRSQMYVTSRWVQRGAADSLYTAAQEVRAGTNDCNLLVLCESKLDGIRLDHGCHGPENRKSPRFGGHAATFAS